MEVSVLIHAPPIPKESSKKGPTQQAEAPIAANSAPAPSHEVFEAAVCCSVVMRFAPI